MSLSAHTFIFNIKSLKPLSTVFILILLFAPAVYGETLLLKSSGYVDELSYCTLNYVTPLQYIPPKPEPFLGITFAPHKPERLIPDSECSEVIKVMDVIQGTSAMNAGIKAGDLILFIDGQSICEGEGDILTEFRERIKRFNIGAMTEIEVFREEEHLTFNVELTAKPVYRLTEAVHLKPNRCGADISILQRALSDKGALSLFNDIRRGLDYRSDTMHNMNWFYRQLYNPFQSKELTYMMRHPMAAPETAEEISSELLEISEKQDIENLMKAVTPLMSVDISGTSSQVDISFQGLLDAFEKASLDMEKILKQLTEKERDLVYKSALKPWEGERWNLILELALKTDIRGTIKALYPLFSYMEPVNLRYLYEDIRNNFDNLETSTVYESSPFFGKIIVGGRGPNIYDEDVALLIDMGGDDMYLNNAGGTRKGMPVSLVIDFAGNDSYITKENFSQGSGILGGGFLIDFAGRNTFSAFKGSQGAGFFGVGIIINRGDKAVFETRSFSQGVAQLGVGLVINSGGDSKFICSQWGQGLGLFGGAGVLIDTTGSDFYYMPGIQPDFRDPSQSKVSMGQGFGRGFRPTGERMGVSGGTGILIDGNGDDIYIADYFAQGSSYYYGLGILFDRNGRDRYLSGRYSQGAGIHSTTGILIDSGGDDLYYASYGVSQGTGHDFGIGFLKDLSGNDQYYGKTLVQGAATRGSIGILSDIKGNDRYNIIENGQAFAQNRKAMGILLDHDPEKDILSKHKIPEKVRLGYKKAKTGKPLPRGIDEIRRKYLKP